MKIVAFLTIIVYVSCTNPSLIANPDLVDVNDTVIVTWKNVGNASETDSILLSFDNGAEMVSKLVKWCPTWKLGYGWLPFRVLNMRHSYVFKYVKSSDKSIVSTSNIIRVNATRPMNGHLALTGDPTEMRISWNSNSTSIPFVVYGTEPQNCTMIRSGTWTTYDVNDLCWKTYGGKDSLTYFIDPGFLHTAVMNGLKPNTKYFYRFGSKDGLSEEFSFISAQTYPSEGVNIIAFGDSGASDCWTMNEWCEPDALKTTNLIQKDIEANRYDMIMHIGDLSYATGFATQWEQFMFQIEPIATKVPYMVGIGNHEYDYYGQEFAPSWGNYADDSRGECGIPYLKRFTMPNKSNLWYSVDYPMVHVVTMSSEHNFTEGSEQYKWLEQDLSSVDRRNQWILFFGHRPGYSSSNQTNEFKVNNRIREILEPLLVKYKVDVAFWGHMHVYERTCPVINSKCIGDYKAPGGPVHYTIGTGGQGLFYEWIDVPWSLKRLSTFGYIRIHVPSLNQIQIEFVGDEDGNILDSVTINKNFW